MTHTIFDWPVRSAYFDEIGHYRICQDIDDRHPSNPLLVRNAAQGQIRSRRFNHDQENASTMPKRQPPPPARGKPKRQCAKGHGVELTKREALALGYRRWIIRERAKEAKAQAASEAKSEARHKRVLAQREKTNKLALRRVEACQKHPSPHAIGQLAAIAQNGALQGKPRVAAAMALLSMARFTSDPPEA